MEGGERGAEHYVPCWGRRRQGRLIVLCREGRWT